MVTSDIEDTYIASQPSKEDKSQLIENKIIELEIAEKDNDLEPPKINVIKILKPIKLLLISSVKFKMIAILLLLLWIGTAFLPTKILNIKFKFL